MKQTRQWLLMRSGVAGTMLGLVAIGAPVARGAATGTVEPATTEAPRLHSLMVQAPLDVELSDNLLSVCVNRPFVANCDYRLIGNAGALLVPLKGSISIASGHVFDDSYITQLRSDLNQRLPRADAGHLRLVLAYAGSGCNVTTGNTLSANMAQFWSSVSLSSDKKTLSWDLTGANAAFFDDFCPQVQDAAKLTLFVPLPLISAGVRYRASITLSNDPSTLRPDYVFKALIITNS